jgi:hypothetical protein
MPAFWRRILPCIVLAVSLPLLAGEADPPARVGRISVAAEGARLYIGGQAASGEAALNWPLTTGAVIETTGAERSEARIGSTALRLDGGTLLEFVQLDDQRIRLRLARGSVAITVRNPEHAAELTLDTSEGRVRFGEAPGSYRADAAGGTVAVSTYLGMAHIEGYGLAVRSGERIQLLGGTDRTYISGQAPADTFRQWSLARELADGPPLARHVSPEMTGQELLEQHGTWQDAGEFGPAWFPRSVPAGWAPYRTGRWGWVPPWGWTWIDSAPWGFAPFHYGRWTLIGGRWAWLPGAYVAKPVFAPALVAWPDRTGWSITISIGTPPAGGWYPLGPREAYYPHYRCSVRHVRNINVPHVRDVTRIVSTVAPPREHEHRHVHRRHHETVSFEPRHVARTGEPDGRSARLGGGRAIVLIPSLPLPPTRFPLRDRQTTDAGRAASPAPDQGYPTRPAPDSRPQVGRAHRPHAAADRPPFRAMHADMAPLRRDIRSRDTAPSARDGRRR